MRNQHAQRFTRAVSFLFFRCLPIADFAHSRLLTEVADRSFMKCEFPSLKSTLCSNFHQSYVLPTMLSIQPFFLPPAISRIPRFVGYTSSLSTHVPHPLNPASGCLRALPIVNPLGGAPIFLSLTHYYYHHPAQAPFSQYRYQQLSCFSSDPTHRHAHSRVLGISLPVVQVGGGLVVMARAGTCSSKKKETNPRQRSAVRGSRDLSQPCFLPSNPSVDRWPWFHFRGHHGSAPTKTPSWSQHSLFHHWRRHRLAAHRRQRLFLLCLLQTVSRKFSAPPP